MNDLDAIKHRLENQKVLPQWLREAFTSDEVSWLVAEVESMRAMLKRLEFGSMGACRFCSGHYTHDADCEWVKAMGI